MSNIRIVQLLGDAIMNTKIPIGQVKRDISEMINRVAYGNERIVLTSRGKPKAALVSMEDYETLQSLQTPDQARLTTWMQTTQALAHAIREKQGGALVDVDTMLDENRSNLEDRDAWITHRD